VDDLSKKIISDENLLSNKSVQDRSFKNLMKSHDNKAVFKDEIE